MKFLLALLPALGRHAAAGLGVGAIILYLLAREGEQVCVNYPTIALACLVLWITQRGIGRV